MRNRLLRLRGPLASIACAGLLLLGQSVMADDVKQEIIASNQKLTYEGGGKHFEIVGDNDEITITGECSKVEVLGHDNKISLETVGDIQAAGHNNLVTYRSGLNGEKPKIGMIGHDNKIATAR
jgi:Protein of unknown function (DUF3060)